MKARIASLLLTWGCAGAARSQWMGSEEAKVGDECRDEARGWW